MTAFLDQLDMENLLAADASGPDLLLRGIQELNAGTRNSEFSRIRNRKFRKLKEMVRKVFCEVADRS